MLRYLIIAGQPHSFIVLWFLHSIDTGVRSRPDLWSGDDAYCSPPAMTVKSLIRRHERTLSRFRHRIIGLTDSKRKLKPPGRRYAMFTGNHEVIKYSTAYRQKSRDAGGTQSDYPRLLY